MRLPVVNNAGEVFTSSSSPSCRPERVACDNNPVRTLSGNHAAGVGVIKAARASHMSSHMTDWLFRPFGLTALDLLGEGYTSSVNEPKRTRFDGA